MNESSTATNPDAADAALVDTKRLDTKLLIVPILLVAIYTMLSVISLFNQDTFFDSMDIPRPENEFMIWSWGGKNTAMVSVLVMAVITRMRIVMITAMIMLLVGQAGDINAGAQSGTNVFITYIALGLVVVQLALLAADQRREQVAVDT